MKEMFGVFCRLFCIAAFELMRLKLDIEAITKPNIEVYYLGFILINWSLGKPRGGVFCIDNNPI